MHVCVCVCMHVCVCMRACVRAHLLAQLTYMPKMLREKLSWLQDQIRKVLRLACCQVSRKDSTTSENG